MATYALPLPGDASESLNRTLPDYLPARMVNEFVYCPRLFFYEWVEGIFVESSDTVEGAAQHKRVDKPDKSGLLSPEAAGEQENKIHTRSAMLSSEAYRVIAKMDLIEIENGVVTPVDYKRGKPYEENGELKVWPADRAQLAVQALVLRENGYNCAEGVIYYGTTKQRVRIEFTEDLMNETVAAIHDAWALARHGEIPPPLDGSPKCAGCSLAPVCLPDEVHRLTAPAEPNPAQLLLFLSHEAPAPKKNAASEIRQLGTPRDERKPVYLDTQGLRIGRSGAVLQAKEKERTVQEIRLNEVCQVNLMGNIQITTQAVQALCEAGIPLCYFSQGGWFYGITTGLSTKNVFLRQKQFAMAEQPWFCRNIAARLTAGKIRNGRTLLLRNHLEPPTQTLSEMKEMADRAEKSQSLAELLGLEGNAARLYFGAFNGLLKEKSQNGTDDPFEDPIGTSSDSSAFMRLDFHGRNRRPPRDPVNALLSLGYSMLAKDLQIACYAVGFDPMVGFYHQPRFGRPALALDLMEPFRPLIVDSAVVNAINTRMITARDFIMVGPSVMLKPEARKSFYRAYELRMDSLVTHPLFDYRVSYRRLLEIQVRLLAKLLEGEISHYPVFTTR